ncbi:MAG: hypothetical protein ACRC62_31675 [Microcoleus sp.]
MGRTRKRPTAIAASIPQAIESIKTIATENQAIVDESVTAVLTAFAKDDAAIVQDIMTAANPIDRLARIISQVSRSVPAGSGTPELIQALDDLRYALNPSLKPMSDESASQLFSTFKSSSEWSFKAS